MTRYGFMYTASALVVEPITALSDQLRSFSVGLSKRQLSRYIVSSTKKLDGTFCLIPVGAYTDSLGSFFSS